MMELYEIDYVPNKWTLVRAQHLTYLLQNNLILDL